MNGKRYTGLHQKRGNFVRILMIAPEPFLEPRGTPFSVYHRVKALVTLGYEVDLVTYPIGKQVTMSGLKIYRAPALPFIRKVKIGPSLAKFPLDLFLFLTALWRLCSQRYRYLHTHEEAGLMGVILASVFGCKHLYDMHSDLSQQMSNFAFTKSKLLIRCVEAVQMLIVRRADVVIAICPDLEQTVKRLAPGKSVHMIENVAVDEALPPANESDVARLRQQWNLGTHPILLYTGTFESYQGIELLLRSVALVRSTFPTARYVLVGGKPEQVEKQRILAQELGIAEMVCFVGQRPLEEMPQYMALADILLSPRSEGTNTPLKLYTYLRSGKPILATDIFSHTQILTSRMAMLVQPTPEGLARGALELLNNPEQAQQLGEYGRSVAERNYSWSAFLEKNRKVYNDFTSLADEFPGRVRAEIIKS
jgi:glycosyltransferase involved in cell wall biosynthesis